MKKISVLLMSIVGATVLVACNGGDPTPTPTPTPDSPSVKVDITPNDIKTGINANLPIMINAVANMSGIESFTMSLSSLSSDGNLNGVAESLNCNTVNISADSNNCSTNFLLKPTGNGEKSYLLDYSYYYNNEKFTGTTNFNYDIVAGQTIDGVGINTNYIYGTTTLEFTNTNPSAKTISSLTPTSGFSIINDNCTGKAIVSNGNCSVTISPTVPSVTQTKQLYSTQVASSNNSLTINYSDNTSATYDINIEAFGYPINNINTRNGFIRIRYQWQNPSPVGYTSNNRDLDTKTGFIGAGNFAAVNNEFLGFGFGYQNIGYYGMMSGSSPENALTSPDTFMAWAGDTISGQKQGLATEDILVDFSKVNAFGSISTIQIPLAAHWFSRSNTTDDNFNIIIDVFPAGTAFEYENVNGNHSFITSEPSVYSYSLPAYTTIVNSSGGIYGTFDTFGAVSCNLANSTCIYQ
ncbi:MAG: hypothetical protein EKK57_02545 [Proteobacteria bacterium]|nr:MAG: hypothetical protein EKK57_02545 [Pseudomonadota bacterium]